MSRQWRLIPDQMGTSSPSSHLPRSSKKVSFAEARLRETIFFEETVPWCNKPGLSERMGTPHLMKVLSKLLGGVINSAYALSFLSSTQF